MNWVILVLIGLVLGWFIELLIDYFYWRRRRICTDAEVNLQASLNEANAANTDLRSQLDEVHEGLDAGADLYILKPVSKSELIGAVTQALSD